MENCSKLSSWNAKLRCPVDVLTLASVTEYIEYMQIMRPGHYPENPDTTPRLPKSGDCHLKFFSQGAEVFDKVLFPAANRMWSVFVSRCWRRLNRDTIYCFANKIILPYLYQYIANSIAFKCRQKVHCAHNNLPFCRLTARVGLHLFVSGRRSVALSPSVRPSVCAVPTAFSKWEYRRCHVTRKPSCRWQTRATRKHAKNCSNSTCLQRCWWQYHIISYIFAQIKYRKSNIPT